MGDTASSDKALQELLTLIEDYHDLNPGAAEVHAQLPTALQFCKQVSKGLPCIYRVTNYLDLFRASQWTKSDLINAVSQDVEVAVTPDGRADSLCTIAGDDEVKVFLQPANIDMTMRELFEKLEASVETPSPVYYLQSQNGNLTGTPLAPLFEDLPQNFKFAEAVLGEPEAVNIWIGDERSVTSAHRDPYENLYIVLRGSKIFTLWPPVDEITLDAKFVRTGRLQFNSRSSDFSTNLDENDEGGEKEPPRIPWVTVDPLQSREHLNRQHPHYKHARPQKITVEAGQMLYLPSGWFHHVAQKCGTWNDGSRSPCISVNYWYDQDYEGEKYVMRQLINRITQQIMQS